MQYKGFRLYHSTDWKKKIQEVIIADSSTNALYGKMILAAWQ